MSQLTVPQLVILEKLYHLHAVGEDLKIPKSHLKLAFPLNNSTIDYNLATRVLGPFGFRLVDAPTPDNYRNARWIRFTKLSDSDTSANNKAA